jgi:hypothetical protein
MTSHPSAWPYHGTWLLDSELQRQEEREDEESRAGTEDTTSTVNSCR